MTWRQHALCRVLVSAGEADPNDWFPVPLNIGEKRLSAPGYVFAACEACEIRRECYDGAMERAEPWGVWGGVDFALKATQRTIRRQRRARAA